MSIHPATGADLPRFKALYEEAIAFQRQAGHPYWKDLDFGVIVADIAAGGQFVLSVDGHIAGIFSFCAPSALDEDLWHDRAPQQARYIHRIIVGQAWRGRQLLAPMLAWCEQATARQGLSLLRLDTWADNPALIAYYERHGFVLVGERTSSSGPHLAAQYRGLRLAIMEKTIAR
jgi:ribosomal protein S18 acetylase RimI-like enzyme